MNIDKAIELLKELKRGVDSEALLDHPAAIEMGIEALIFRQRWEDQEGEDDFPLLPGETRE